MTARVMRDIVVAQLHAPVRPEGDRVLAVWVFWLRPELDQVAQGATDALHTPVARALILVGQIDAHYAGGQLFY